METSETLLGGADCEKALKALMFDDLSADEQIQKLRYELQCAARAIARIGNDNAMLRKHEHGNKGNVVVGIENGNREFTCDRSEFLK